MADNISKIFDFLPKWGKQESKSCSTSSSRDITLCELNSILGGYALGAKMGWMWLQAEMAWRYYKQVDPVFNGVEAGAEGFESIQPQVFDTKDETYHGLHDDKAPLIKILKLLNKPNTDQSGVEFRGASARSYYVTGNMYWIGKAATEKLPFTDIEYVNPIDIDVEPDLKGGVKYYRYYHGSTTTQFHAVELEGDIRYFTKDMRWELWHVKRFNPDRSARSNSSLVGMSQLNPLYLELEQLISSKIHNWSLLENGARPSGALTIDKDTNLTDDQFNRLKTHVKEFYQNPTNAGNVLFIEGGKDFKELSISNKDMDFFNLTKEDKKEVARNLKVPLPLIESESQTFSNFSHAEAILYTRNILPFASLYYEELNRFALRRYSKGDNRYKIWYDVRDIPALQLVQTEIAKTKGETGALTIDELRAILDKPPLEEGGNVIYQTSTLVPVGVASENKSIRNIETKARFVDIMQKQVDINGERIHTDEFIAREAERLYGDIE